VHIPARKTRTLDERKSNAPRIIFATINSCRTSKGKRYHFPQKQYSNSSDYQKSYATSQYIYKNRCSAAALPLEWRRKRYTTTPTTMQGMFLLTPRTVAWTVATQYRVAFTRFYFKAHHNIESVHICSIYTFSELRTFTGPFGTPLYLALRISEVCIGRGNPKRILTLFPALRVALQEQEDRKDRSQEQQKRLIYYHI